MKKHAYISLITLVIIALTNFIIIIVPHGVSASQVEVTISLEDTTEEVNIDSGSSGRGVFHGNVQCNLTGLGQNIQQVKVELNVKAGDWSASVNPMEMEFESDNENSKPFIADVLIPRFTSASETRELIVSGVATVEPGGKTYPIESVMGIITIKPFLMISMNCTESDKTTKGGNTIQYHVTIKNNGNTDGVFTIGIPSEDELVGFGLGIEISEEEILINENGVTDIYISVKVPDIDSKEVFVIYVWVEASLQDDTKVVDNHAWYLVVRTEARGENSLLDNWYLLVFIVFIVVIIVCWRLVIRRRNKEKRK